MSTQQRNSPRGTGRKKRRSWLPEAPEDGTELVLTDDQRTRLNDRSFNYVIWSLGQGPRTRHQLVTALNRKDVPADIIDAVLARVEEYGYVNDAKFAENYTRSLASSGRKGRRAIAMDLRRKGVDADLITEATETIDDETEYASVVALARKRLRTAKGVDTRKDDQRIAAYLARRGFNPGDIFRAIAEARAED